MASDRPEHPSPARIAGEAAAAVAEVEAALSPEPDPTAAAFFDIDNTVVRGASIFYLAMGLARRRFFDLGDVVGFVSDQVKFRILGAEDMGDMADATETALGFVKDHAVAEVVQIGREIFDESIGAKVYPGTLALARAHLDAGQRVWLVSAAPVELATIIAKRLGLTGALGTVSEIRHGVYTGRLVGRPLHGPAKAEAIKALAEREGLDLSRCAAYSDSANDIPMLSLVGEPTAVNPDTRLRRHARDLGWRIIDYRTGRKVAKVGLPVLAGAGVLSGVAAAAVAVDRRRRPR
ncbi:MAG: HAD-IB family hydrolase [Actinomycetia bacterium]|jgi:HAD superfamily hydrolase (TIGR01490 family)|nr:HAD-IB family hydrolase [Actinomycetes bacterium]